MVKKIRRTPNQVLREKDTEVERVKRKLKAVEETVGKGGEKGMNEKKE